MPGRTIALLALAYALHAAAAPAIDDAREDRWASEVVPGIVVGDAIWLATPSRTRVLAILTLPTKPPKAGIVIVHGLGVHPDFGMIGGLRTLLADAGYATLAVQMPVLAAGASSKDYAGTLPAAGERLGAAIALLRARGITRIAIVSHSVGATMTDAFLARRDAPRIDAWVPVGMPIDFAVDPREPVLDVAAEHELPPVVEAAPLRAKRLPHDGCSRALTIADADHYFDQRRKELAAAIGAFLDRVFGDGCAGSVPSRGM